VRTRGPGRPADPRVRPQIAASGTSTPTSARQHVAGAVVVALLVLGLAGCTAGSGGSGRGTATAQPSTTGPPSAAPTATAPSRTPVAGAPLVVLDPGHNGGNGAHPAEIRRLVPDGRGSTKACNTTGTSTDAGYPEHAFTFDVALRTERALEAAGVRVVLTRPNDTGVGPCVDVRGAAGNRADAVAMVSIHADGAAASGSGFHVALSDPPLNPVQAGQAHVLGTALRDALRVGGFHDSTYVGAHGISLRPDLAGLNLATRPAALVECANMRNPVEAAVVASADGRQRYAAALAAGIVAYLQRP
jgi:N-acetylmuramoyl-L-alanine amidase